MEVRLFTFNSDMIKGAVVKFWGLVLSAIFCIGLIDFAVGKACDNMVVNMPNIGEIGETNYSLYHISNKNLIIGSSRAFHHYVPSIINDSLNTDFYNCGRDAFFLSENCCAINAILKRYTPEHIVWEINDSYFYGDKPERLNMLYPYIKYDKYIENIIYENDNSFSNHIKMHSSLYRYNTVGFRILWRMLSPGQPSEAFRQGGYKGLEKKMGSFLILKDADLSTYNDNNLNHRKIRLFEEIVKKTCGAGCNLTVVMSPRFENFQGQMTTSTKIIKGICKKYGVQFLDNRQLQFFMEHPELFYDESHLNSEGAIIYTKLFASQLRRSNG